jgi:hypothetical protein
MYKERVDYNAYRFSLLESIGGICGEITAIVDDGFPMRARDPEPSLTSLVVY